MQDYETIFINQAKQKFKKKFTVMWDYEKIFINQSIKKAK